MYIGISGSSSHPRLVFSWYIDSDLDCDLGAEQSRYIVNLRRAWRKQADRAVI